MVAASAADLDGLGLLAGVEYYAEYHHVLSHNWLFGVLLAAGLGAFSTHRLKMFLVCLLLFHLHLVMDYYGSGLGWSIHYFWPFSTTEIVCDHAWELASWQNFLAFGVLLGWTLVIFVRRRRTPLEVICPSLDARAVRRFARSA